MLTGDPEDQATEPFTPPAVPSTVAPLSSSGLTRLWGLARQMWPGLHPRALYQRGRLIAKGLAVYSDARPLLQPGPIGLGRAVRERPEIAGSILWPWINVEWDTRTRLRRIRDHYEVVTTSFPILDVSPSTPLLLTDLGDLRPGLTLVLDQAVWFMREGELVLNLFDGETRLFSLAFALRREPELAVYVGAIQGRNLEGVMDTYRELTGVLHGMRPRDFLIEVLARLARVLGATRILAVSDRSRVHRSPYFGKGPKKFMLNYDEVWTERGGVAIAPDFFEMPPGGALKDLNDVPSKKRSMYRKRYGLLDQIEGAIAARLGR